MDKLSEIFMMQQAFDTELVERRHLNGISMEEWMQKETIALIAELMEMLGEVNYKWWKNPKEVDMEASSIFVECWHGPWCYETSTMEDSATFPMSEEGRRDMKKWLEDRV